MSIAGINYQNGKLRNDPALQWYWAPFAATWLFTILIAYFMYRASCDYIDMRQYYFRLPSNEGSMKSLMVSKIPKEKQTDKELKSWIESTRAIQYPIKDSMMGHHSSKLTELFEKHEEAVQQLETTLASYLGDGKKNTDNKKRPTVRVGGFLFCGGRKVDAIDYYTKQVSDLDAEIKQLRKQQGNIAPYGWISFDKIEYAHASERALEAWLKKTKNDNVFHVRLSPTPKNLVWNNLPLSDKARSAKRWTGRIIYWVFVFAWFIPMTALSATSNVINLIRLIPNSADFIESHQVLIGLIQAYFTPIVMAIFFYLLPMFFRFLSQQQGYWTQTTLDRKVLVKLYIFFIINNLLVFTLTSMFIGIYGQLRALIQSGTIPADQGNISDYIMQIAKNISEVSTFWINFVCLKSLGLTMDLAMLVPLVTITLKKLITRPSPRELRELAKPPEFNFPQNYNLLLFFFTITLVYSAMSPLILPFALVYFTVASMVYKYLLMYVYETKIESGGKIWPVLFQTIMTSVIFFQVTMIIILVLKGGHLQAYILIPLPVLTLVFQYLYYRRMHVLGSYLIGSDSNLPSAYVDESFVGDGKRAAKKSSVSSSLRKQFQDPAYHDKLSKPTVHGDVKHLLSKVYKDTPHSSSHQLVNSQQQQQGRKDHFKINETIEMAQNFGKNTMHQMDLDKQKGFNNKHHLYDVGCPIQFETVNEEEILDKEEESDNEGEEDGYTMNTEHEELSRINTLSSSNYAPSSYHNQSDTTPLLQQQPPPLPSHNNNRFLSPQARQPLSNERNVTSEYIEMYSSFTPNASGDDYNSSNLRNVSLDEFGDGNTVLNANVVTHKPLLIDPEFRRHTDPYIHAVLDDEKAAEEEEENAIMRHQSMPNMYRPFLATMDYLSSEEEEEEIEQMGTAVHLRRQLSVPVHRLPGQQKQQGESSSNLKRHQTMPTKSRHVIKQPAEHQQQQEYYTSSPIDERSIADDNEKILVEKEEGEEQEPRIYHGIVEEQSFVDNKRFTPRKKFT